MGARNINLSDVFLGKSLNILFDKSGGNCYSTTYNGCGTVRFIKICHIQLLTSAIRPWQTHLGARRILILHQDDTVMQVNILSTKLEQLLNTSPKKGCRRSTRRDLGTRVLLEPSSKEGQGTASYTVIEVDIQEM